jgi:glycosyltransferase involved in cell wall biosynthesis
MAAIRQAAGVQCNGTPTYDVFRRANTNALLYFDTRVTGPMLIGPGQLEERLAASAGQPLRLLFSGRLIAMKGAADLIVVARELKAMGVPFQLTICGDGALLPVMRRQIGAWGLQGCVRLAGVLDFHEELIPHVQRHTDLFLCCHRQGDPSCTYLETMSCGVPIVGYDNEAFEGVVKTSGCGWLVPMNDPWAMATKVAELAPDREQLRRVALASLAFAADNTFDATFERRIAHLRAIARKSVA